MNEKFLVFGNLYTYACGEEREDYEGQQVVILDTSNGSLIALEKTEMITRQRIINTNTLRMTAFVYGENGFSEIGPEMVSERLVNE